MRKLKSLREFLHSWNKSTFGHVDINIFLAKQHLVDIQRNIDEFGFLEDLHSQELEAHQRLEFHLESKYNLLIYITKAH